MVGSDHDLEAMLQKMLCGTEVTVLALQTTVPYLAQVVRVARRMHPLVRMFRHIVSGNGVLVRVFMICSFRANANVRWTYFPANSRGTFAAIPWV